MSKDRTLLVTATDRNLLERETAHALVNLSYGPPTNELDAMRRDLDYGKLLTILPTYSNETLQRYIATAATDLGWNLKDFLCNSEANEEYVNDWIIIEPTALGKDVNSVPIIKGFTQYEHLAPQQNGHYPTRRIEQAIAITCVTAHLGETGHGLLVTMNHDFETMHYIEDKQLRDLLTTHENPTAIADLIISRNLSDPEQITALLNTMNDTATAINGGAL